jgi:hypothetical protein
VVNSHTAAKLNAAKHATRTCRRDGRSERFVFLWDSKHYNEAKCVGRVSPKSIEAAAKIGLWEHSSPMFRDGSDTAQEHWWKVEVAGG